MFLAVALEKTHASNGENANQQSLILYLNSKPEVVCHAHIIMNRNGQIVQAYSERDVHNWFAWSK